MAIAAHPPTIPPGHCRRLRHQLRLLAPGAAVSDSVRGERGAGAAGAGSERWALSGGPDLSRYFHAEGMKTPGDEHFPAVPYGAQATPFTGGFGPAPTLTADEISFFKTNGFLVKRSLIPRAKVAAGVDRVWRHLEGAPIPGVPEALQLPSPSGVLRDRPESWIDAHKRWPAPDLLQARTVGGSHASTTWEVADSLRGTPYEAPGGNGQRAPSSRNNHSPSWQICGLGDAPWLIDLVPDDERVQAVARQLLGGALRKTQRVRGLYSIFPSRYAPIRSG